MSNRQMHLGWFTNYMTPEWNGQYSGNAAQSWINGDFYVDMARSLDRACFDFMMLEDSSVVFDVYGGSFAMELKHMVRAPKHDPVPLVPVLARATTNLGVVATCSTSFYPPYLLARTMATLDHLTGGRAGWNIVTSVGDRAAQNYGMDSLPEHDLRYDMADEFVEIVDALWSSWEPDALIVDREAGTYIDHSKVRAINYEGKYHSSRGPLNTLPPPQGRPVVCQAGGSPRGRRFAAAHADVVIAIPKGIDEMRTYRDEVRAAAEEAGRDPDSIKVMYIVSPVIADTESEAKAKRDRAYEDSQTRLEKRLLLMSGGELDFAQFDLDEPLPEFVTQGSQSILDTFRRQAQGKTLREAASDDQTESIELVGTPNSVAEQMGEAMAVAGGDGFLIYSGSGLLTRRYISEITDGLVPALQKRGLMRTEFGGAHFRDNLLAF